MSDNEKINHLLERASLVCLSLEEVNYKENARVYRGSALSVLSLYLWLETGKEILLHPGHATKESWDPITTQKACWEKPISSLAMQEHVGWKGQPVNAARWAFNEVKWGSAVTMQADCRWWRLFVFSQTLIRLFGVFAFVQSIHEYLTRNSFVSPVSPHYVWLEMLGNNVVIGT